MHAGICAGGGSSDQRRPVPTAISRAFLHGALPGRIRWWAGDFGRIGRAGHRRGDVAAFIRQQKPEGGTPGGRFGGKAAVTRRRVRRLLVGESGHGEFGG